MELFLILLILVSVIAGIIGSLFGIGGGIVIIPVLILLFHVSVKEAIGASIISVIVTSSAAASVYIKSDIVNFKLGMLLEIFTVLGAITGALLLGVFNPKILLIIFSVVLTISSFLIFLKKNNNNKHYQEDHISKYFDLDSKYYDESDNKVIEYHPAHISYGFISMYIAGLISGLLGIGSGVFKVTSFDSIMKIPMKVSTTTSNFMIGVTACASAFIYLVRGYINPYISIPVAVGIFLGAMIGTKILYKQHDTTLKSIFFVILIAIALEMFFRALGIL